MLLSFYESIYDRIPLSSKPLIESRYLENT